MKAMLTALLAFAMGGLEGFAANSQSPGVPGGDRPSLSSVDETEAARREWCSQPNTAAGESHNWRVRSHKHCNSVQGIEVLSPPIHSSAVDFDRIVGKEWKWQYQGRDSGTCKHEWQKDVSRAVPTAIANGQVVLVREDEVYGGFMLTAQSAKPEMAQFIWRYGTDATGGFDTSDPNVNWSAAPESVQERKDDLMIEFGPFEICWSGSLGDKSWIYYGKFPGDELAENGLAICVTEKHSFDTIRPRDAKWRYRRSPVDGS